MDPPIRRVHFYTKCIKAHLAGGSFAQSMLSYFVFTHWAMIVGMLLACYKGRPSAAQDCCTAEEVRALYQPWPCQVHWVAPTVTPHFSLQGLAPKREEEMGLAGGIVRKVFSKSPCSSAGGRGHNEKSSADHRRRWSSLRLYLCGEEINTALEEEEDDEGTVSVKSFETCAMTQEAQFPTAQQSDVHSNTGDNPVEPARTEEAARLIQSAFRRFLARGQLREQRRCASLEWEIADEPRSPTSASVEVQVGESFSNLRLSEDSASVQQPTGQKSRPPPVFRVKEEWDDSTVSSNVSRKRMQSRIEATTRRERALAYAFSQQLRSCGGTKKRSARPDQAEFNVGWSWLERWMATRQAEPADDCMSRNADTGSARRVVVVRRCHDLAVEEKESCGSNDVSAVSFDGSNGSGSRLRYHKPGRNRLKGGGKNLPRRKVASADHRPQGARSHKMSKKKHHPEEHEDQADTQGFDANQPPTDY